VSSRTARATQRNPVSKNKSKTKQDKTQTNKQKTNKQTINNQTGKGNEQNLQDLEMEIETIKKSQRETTLELSNLGKRSGVIDANITKRMQEIEERISEAEDNIENIDTTVKEHAKMQKSQKIQEINDTKRRPNLKIIGIEESENSKLKGPVNIFNKFIEENFPNLKKEMPMNIQEVYRTPNRLDQKRNISCHILFKPPNALNSLFTRKGY
jgi:chromosome segregation ATPase